ncbi:hypothetical protein [Stenotrophomonas sp. SORGH_AS_0282]|uniref:hypothetical protein n=1 Tax=Stenotrophomonas sp. SORGH_AS_0282 TaxID=3041763 RepID=UPI0027D8CF34|nr:hypothetical protein [Stenotrophomonas sp. SORGH_AS_0282]
MPAAVALVVGVAGCAGHDRLTTVDSRAETVGHQRLRADATGGPGQVEAYTLKPSEGYRMPQLYAAPDPVLGDRDPRRELPPTTVCLQVVVSADGAVERSVPVSDRSECIAGAATENRVLVEAAQEAVAMWRYSPAAVCHFAAGRRAPADRSDCRDAERVEPVAVSLFYAFTFEIVHGQHTVKTR